MIIAEVIKNNLTLRAEAEEESKIQNRHIVTFQKYLGNGSETTSPI
jgi:hypothetical protein